MGFIAKLAATVLIGSVSFILIAMINSAGLPLFSGVISESGLLILGLLIFVEIFFAKL